MEIYKGTLLLEDSDIGKTFMLKSGVSGKLTKISCNAWGETRYLLDINGKDIWVNKNDFSLHTYED